MSGLEFTKKLAEILGLGGVPIKSITIETNCSGSYPEVIVKKTITSEESSLVVALLSSYKLMEKEPDVVIT